MRKLTHRIKTTIHNIVEMSNSRDDLYNNINEFIDNLELINKLTYETMHFDIINYSDDLYNNKMMIEKHNLYKY